MAKSSTKSLRMFPVMSPSVEGNSTIEEMSYSDILHSSGARNSSIKLYTWTRPIRLSNN